MKQKKSKLIFVLIMQFAFLLIFASSIISNSPTGMKNATLKSSDVHTRIIINANWTDAKTAGVCIGSGTQQDPYVIRDIEIDGMGIGTCITIINTVEYFRIENCSVHGSGDGSVVNDAGIFLQNVSNGVIHENAIFGNYYGIYIIDSGNVTVTYNNIGNVRGMKTITLHSTIWLYLNSFTSSFYEIYFDDLNTVTFETPTQFLYEFHGQNYTSYLGNYWSGKLDECRDDNNDGVTDVPIEYTGGTINFTRYNVHYYALMEPHSNYLLIEPWFEPESKIPGYNLLVLGAIIAFSSLYLVLRNRKQ